MKNKLLGINVDYLTMDQAVETVDKWLQKKGKHYIVTPNPEMIVDADRDNDFKRALNSASLSISDSPRLGWANKILNSKHPIFKFIYLPFVLFPKIISGNQYPTISGVDLTERLIMQSEEKAYTTAYLGGSNKVADKLFKCLRVKYPKLKIVFCSGNINVNENGEINFDINKYKMSESKEIKHVIPANAGTQLAENSWELEPLRKRYLLDPRLRGDDKFNPHSLTKKIDILFVAFGHKKQEKWIYNNLPKLNVRIMMGVGGAFDYLSGSIPRAPLILRSLGLEWLFRLIVQPWRIKRFWKLFKFVYMVMTAK